MARLPEPCLTCGKVTTNGSRCPLHAQQTNAKWAAKRQERKEQTGQYSGAYARLSRIVRATAQICHICGIAFQPGDKIQADHLVPAAYVTDISQLAPAHAYCNASRGNKPLS